VELLAPIFAAFRAAHPAITLELVVANAFFTLSRRDADVAVRPSAEAPEELIAHRVADVATALYASRSHAAAQARTPPAERHWIGPDESLSHLAAARWLRRHTAPEQVVYRANSLLAWQAAARAGLGLALLPCYLGDVDPQLVRIAPPIAELGAALWVLIHPDLRRVARIRAFVDFALPRLDGLRPLLEGRQRRAGAPDRESYNGAQTALHERAPQHVRPQARRSSAAKRGYGSATPKRP